MALWLYFAIIVEGVKMFMVKLRRLEMPLLCAVKLLISTSQSVNFIQTRC